LGPQLSSTVAAGIRIVYTVRVSRVRPMHRMVSFRVDDLDFIRLTALKATFPDPTMRSAFLWLLTQPEVQRLIRQRLEAEQLELVI